MAARQHIVVLTELVEPDGDQFAAYCLELGTTPQLITPIQKSQFRQNPP